MLKKLVRRGFGILRLKIAKSIFGLNIKICPPTTTPGPIPDTGMATRIIRIPSGGGRDDFGLGIVSNWDLEFEDKI